MSEKLKKAVNDVGQTTIAKRMGVTPQAVQQWVANGRVPFKRVVEFEKAIEGRVTRHDLFPEIFGPAPPLKAKRTAPSSHEAAA